MTSYIIARCVNDGIEFGLDYVPDHGDTCICHYEVSDPRPHAIMTTPDDALRFAERFKRMGAGWFLPFLDRMAQGEPVAVGSIQAAYEQQFGHPMPTGTWGEKD